MSERVDDRPNLIAFGEAFLFGVTVPTGVWHVFTSVPTTLPPWLDDALLAVWLAAIAVTCAGVGIWRALRWRELASGGVCGWIFGFLVWSWVFGTGVIAVFIAVMLTGAIPIVLGALGAHGVRRRRETAGEPRASA